MGENKRKMLTPAERVAKAQADLAEAIAKAEAKDRKRHDELQEQLAKVDAMRDKLAEKADVITSELEEIVERVPALADSRPSLSVVDDDAMPQAASV